MVVVDSYETETASFWKREGADPASIATEIFFLPTATVLEKEGTMVNTNRLLQWHDRAIEPGGRGAFGPLLLLRTRESRLKGVVRGIRRIRKTARCSI